MSEVFELFKPSISLHSRIVYLQVVLDKSLLNTMSNGFWQSWGSIFERFESFLIEKLELRSKVGKLRESAWILFGMAFDIECSVGYLWVFFHQFREL